jgi:GNAT superfamily N-acetyltransferase
MTEGAIEPATPGEIDRLVREHWGTPIISIEKVYEPHELEGLAWRSAEDEVQGLVTWAIEDHSAEIVTMDAFVQGAHIGGRLLDAAEAELRGRGVRSLAVVTTNDNLRALSFYVRRGYRLTRVDLDGMERVRAMKPGIPETGQDGLPVRDMWELRKELA